MSGAPDSNNAETEPDPVEVWIRFWRFIIDPKHTSAVAAIATLALCITTILYTIFSALQWTANEKAAEAAKSAAEIASAELILQRHQIEGTEAAKVEFRPLFFQDGKVYFDAQNFGHVISQKVTVDFTIFRGRVSDPGRVNPSGSFHKEIVQMEPVPDANRADPWADQNRQNQWMEILSITPQELGGIQRLDPKYTIIVDGTITYDDGFGQNYTKQIPCFAFVYMPAFSPFNGSPIGSTAETNAMIQCSDYSFWIKNYLQDMARRGLKRQANAY
jgi:hypothetical protein